jgi:hypothetical protein
MQGVIAHLPTPPLVQGAAPGEKFVLTVPEDLAPYPAEVARYAASAYGFLVPIGDTVSLTDFAALIGGSYSLDVPQNAEVVRVLNS